MSGVALTITLREGPVVLAKFTKYGLSAKTFANRTQAEKAAKECGGWVIQWGRPFLVRLDSMESTP